MIAEMESPSLFETIIRLPGAVIRFPSDGRHPRCAQRSRRADRPPDDPARTARGRHEHRGHRSRPRDHRHHVSPRGLQQAVGTLDSSLPSLSDSASALWNLTERLSGVAIELVNGLPWAARSPQDTSPELADVAELLDERFTDLDTVVSDMARLVEAVVGTIPGMRGVIRINSVPFDADPRREDL